MWAGWWAVRSALAEGCPEGGFGTHNRLHSGLDGSSGLGGCGCVGAGDIALGQGSPESGRTGDHRLDASSAGLNGGRLAAHQLHGEGTNDEGAQETGGQGDGAAAGSGRDAAGHDRNSLNRASVWKKLVRTTTKRTKLCSGI